MNADEMNTAEKVLITPIYVPTELPVFICDLKPISQQLELARQAIDELRISHPESPNSNVYATYMSPWKSHYLNDKLKPLCDSVILIAKEASKQVLSANIEALNMDLIVTDCWGIIYEESDHTAFHNHFPAEFGCAIYLEADDNCAPIYFDNKMQFQPRPGTMALFPGILNHSVPQNTGKRVVIAMNINKRALFNPS